MKAEKARKIVANMERHIHHDRVFLNNPVVMQGMGLAPLVIKSIFEIIQRLHEEGITILLVEQNANAALRIADYAFVLETGMLGMQGSGQKLLNDPGIKAAYLGKSA